MKIGIIGTGFVGLSFAAVLGSKGYDVIAVDSDKNKLKKIKNGISPFFEPKLEQFLKKALKNSLIISDDIKKTVLSCDIIFITVGTPTFKDGRIDLRNVNLVAKKIGNALSISRNNPTVVIKSTVVPGTTEKITKILEENSKKKSGIDFGVLMNPEFLRESCAINDTLKPHLIVIGGSDRKTVNKLEKFYKKFHSSKIPIIKTNLQTAELIKYANNSFLATKISFINQIANICQGIPGTNVDDIAKAIGFDPRIGRMFLNAGPGFGGSCLPKDLHAMISFSSKIKQNTILLSAVKNTNRNQVKKILDLIKKALTNIKGKKITVLGLSFKENSDDIRESVSISLIKLLLKNGAKVVVHDPKAIESVKKVFSNKINYTSNIFNALYNSECAVIMTPWEEYKRLTNKDFEIMKNKIIIDTRRLLVDKKFDGYYALGVGN